MSAKKHSFDQLIGKTLTRFSADADAETSTGEKYTLNIEDDSWGGNDSNAYLGSVCRCCEFPFTVTSVEEESDSWDATIILHGTVGQTIAVHIIHEHNGYYGFSYSLENQTHNHVRPN